MIKKGATKGTTISAGKPFYDYFVRMNAGIIDSIADSTNYHNYTQDSGKVKGLSNGGSVTGNITFNSPNATDTVMGRMASAKWWTIANGGTWQDASSAKFIIDSLMYDFPNGGIWFQNSSNSIKRLRLDAGNKKLKIQSGTDTLFLNGNVAGDFSGTNGNPDTLQSTSNGNQTNLYFSVQPVEQYVRIQDVKSINFTLIDTVGGQNGGNTDNVMFKDANNQKYVTPAPIVGTQSLSPSSFVSTGGQQCTVTVTTGIWSPCSIKIKNNGVWGSRIVLNVLDSTKGWFTVPSGVVGAADDTIINADFKVSYKANAFTYTSASTPPVIDSIRPTHGTFNTQVTLYGSDFSDSARVYWNGGLIPHVSRSNTTFVLNATDIGLYGPIEVILKNTQYNTFDTTAWTYDTLPEIDSTTDNQYRAKLFRIRGTTFRASQSTGFVIFGLDTVRVAQTWNDTVIVDTVPALAVRGKNRIRVKNSDNYIAVAPDSVFVRVPSATQP
jgi:hypothetical protein